MRKKSDEKRQAILDVATLVFQEAGFERATMEEIAARVGGSKATLYNYFSSKEKIFVEAMRQQAKQKLAPLFMSMVETTDLRQSLQYFGEQYLQVILSPDFIAAKRLLYSHAAHANLGCTLYESGPKLGWTCISTFFQEIMDKKLLRKMDPWVVASHLRALLEAEWLEVCMLGVVNNVTPAQIRTSVQGAVDVFLCAYEP